MLLVAPTGYGKSALLTELAPTLDTLALTLRVPKVASFRTFLLDLAAALIDAGQPIPGGDLAEWEKVNAGNDAKTRSLVQVLRGYGATGATPPVLLIDDATGITQSMVPPCWPWLTTPR